MDLEFLQTRSGCMVPVINGTLLHSSVDPLREAQLIVEREWALMKNVRHVVVLGLGGGFHIRELLQRGKTAITVIESSVELAEEVIKKDPELSTQVNLVAGLPPARILNEIAIQRALSHSFFIFRHPASQRLNTGYYGAILETLAERNLSALKKMTGERRELNEFFKSLDIYDEQLLTLPMVAEAMARRGTGLDEQGLIWMTIRELVL